MNSTPFVPAASPKPAPRPARRPAPNLRPMSEAQELARADADITQMLRLSNPQRALSLLMRAWHGSDRETFVAALVQRLVLTHDRDRLNARAPQSPQEPKA